MEDMQKVSSMFNNFSNISVPKPKPNTFPIKNIFCGKIWNYYNESWKIQSKNKGNRDDAEDEEVEEFIPETQELSNLFQDK